ncbi:MAG: iron-containing alcohol dehydrogenase [candidate division WOR-3 bacterium]
MWVRYYEFFAPVKILSGEKALENLPNEIRFLNCSKPLILTDKGLRKAGVFDIVIEALKEQKIDDFVVFDEIPPDSDTEVCKQIAKMYNQNQRDIIVAVGGGSVIDTAKGVNIIVSENLQELRDVMGANILRKPLRPLIVIPTTSGTGSEATCAAVIKDRSRDIKMLFVSPYLIPNTAILDLRMTVTLPPLLTAATAMDALTHALEAYISLQKNPISDTFAWKAVETIAKFLPLVLENPKNNVGRLALANASLMAGIAFSNAMVGLVHAIGHAVGAVANVHHGICMNILLPHVLEFNYEKINKELGELLLPLAGEEIYIATPSEQRGFKSIEILYNLREKIKVKSGIPNRLSEAGVLRSQFDTIAEIALRDGSLTFNVKDASYQDIISILEKAF